MSMFLGPGQCRTCVGFCPYKIKNKLWLALGLVCGDDEGLANRSETNRVSDFIYSLPTGLNKAQVQCETKSN